MKIQHQVNLSQFSTIKVGGAAKYFVAAQTEADVISAVRWAEGRGVRFFVLGGGSNVIISDEEFDGLVIKMETRGIEFKPQSDSQVQDGFTIATASAGEIWDDFVTLCIEKNLAGIENLSGIPGTGGGSTNSKHRRLQAGSKRHRHRSFLFKYRHTRSGKVRAGGV